MYTEKEKYTYEDYLKLPEGAPYQLINGELVMSPSPTTYHQIIANNISTLLTQYVRKNKLGTILFSPIDVYFEKHETYQPDIIFVSKERKEIIGEKKIEGAPDLVIEILSESNAYYDLKHKKNIYEKYGVKEYWIVDPIEKSVEVFEGKEKKFTLIDRKEEKGKIKSKVLTGLKIQVEEIFKND